MNAMVFTLVPIYVGAMIVMFLPLHLYCCSGNYIGEMVFILVSLYLYWCHGIYIDAMVFY